MSRWRTCGCALLASLGLSMAQAAYPDPPITMVVPYAAGGPMDKLARQIGAQLQGLLGRRWRSSA